MPEPHIISVLGAGSWGTALAVQLARSGASIRLWGRDADHVDSMRTERCNRRYLDEIPLPDNLDPCAELGEALSGATQVLIAVPSHALRGTLERVASIRGHEPRSAPPLKLSWATKGLEYDTGLLPHQVVAEVFPENPPGAVLSGPTFATEVAQGLPTAITVASSHPEQGEAIAALLSSHRFRAYTSSDVVGVEIGGAVKNVLAIGAGLSDGLGFGANARVALINRGLREMMRLGIALGASAETFMGLAGMGDLVLTCTDNQSRNRRMGLALAGGLTVEDAQREIGQVVEGVAAAKAVHQQAGRVGVEMPIVSQIHEVLFEAVSPHDAVVALLARASGAETD